jgi:mRNA-degrading endonuclease RelE of RelBE toxin-antitoxin system
MTAQPAEPWSTGPHEVIHLGGEAAVAVVAAVDALEGDPYPADSFRWGDMHRLRVGPYRIMYVVEGELITIDRVDRVTG